MKTRMVNSVTFSFIAPYKNDQILEKMNCLNVISLKSRFLQKFSPLKLVKVNGMFSAKYIQLIFLKRKIQNDPE